MAQRIKVLLGWVSWILAVAVLSQLGTLGRIAAPGLLVQLPGYAALVNLVFVRRARDRPIGPHWGEMDQRFAEEARHHRAVLTQLRRGVVSQDAAAVARALPLLQQETRAARWRPRVLDVLLALCGLWLILCAVIPQVEARSVRLAATAALAVLLLARLRPVHRRAAEASRVLHTAETAVTEAAGSGA